jgi:hypothetical protein
LEAGTYDANSNISLSRSGRRSAPIVYRNYGGTALLRYSGGSLSGGVLQTSLGSNWGGAHDIVIEGLTIDGADQIGGGIFVSQGSHHITIRNCVIRNMGSTGIELNATDYVTVEHNLIYHVGYNQGGSSGVTLWYGGSSPAYGGPHASYDRAPGFHNVIANNIISGSYDNSGNEADGNGIVVDGGSAIPPVLIINNVVYENGGRGIEVYNAHGDIWIVNNTGYADGLDLGNSGGQAAEFAALYASTVHFVNDLAYGRQRDSRYSTAYSYMNIYSTISWAHNIGFKGSVYGVGSVGGEPRAYRRADPRFISPPAIPSTKTPWASATPPWSIGNDLTLRSGSPALHAGLDPTTVTSMTTALATRLQRYLSTTAAVNAGQLSGVP